VSREWTDVARQCRRRYQLAAFDVFNIVRGLASGCWLALHATIAATAATTATTATPAVTSVASALALRCPDLHNMLSELLEAFRLVKESSGRQRASSKFLCFPLARPVVQAL